MTVRGLLAGVLTAIAATALVAACGSSTPPSGAAAVAGPARASRIGLQRIGVFSQPVYLTGALGDPHRLFVVERGGFAYAFEHLEIGAYELLRRVARRAGDTETEAVAERILNEERAAADKLHALFDTALDAALRVQEVIAS